MTATINNPPSKQLYRISEQVRILYQNAPVSNSVLFIAAVMFYFVVGSRVDSVLIPLCFSAVSFAAVFRLFLWYLRKRQPDRFAVKTWLNAYVLGSALVGLSWSLAYPLIFLFNDLIIYTALTFLVFSMVGAAAVALSIHLPAFLLYSYPQLFTLSASFLLLDEFVYFILALGGLIYLVMITLFTRNLYRDALRTIDLQAQNYELINELNDEIMQRENIIDQRTAEISEKNAILTREISERKEMGKALGEAKKKAERASQVKSEFLATMSHEIRTPMNGVTGMTSLLLETPLNDEQKHFVSVIQDSTESLIAIINDILDISRLEAQQLKLELIEFDLPKLIESVIHLFKPHADAKKIEIVKQFNNSLDGSYKGDAGRIRQILINLIGNALKFTETGQVIVRFEVIKQDAERELVRFEVQDTGIGIKEANIDDLFNNFVQADASVTNKYGGSGLGLAICKGLVNAMQGTIGVESQLEQGSLFWFELPLLPVTKVQGSERNKAQGISADAINEDHYPQPALRILVADDVIPNQLVARKLIEKFGHQVDVVRNGVEAVDAVKNHPYDLVFMDIRMPEMDGLTATQMIRKIDGDVGQTPIFAMTANAMKEDMSDCIEAGMNDFVAKPVNKDKIRDALNRYFSHFKNLH